MPFILKTMKLFRLRSAVHQIFKMNHCVKSVQIRSFFWSVFGHILRSEYIFMFAWMFLRVLSLFRIIPKWFSFFSYFIWIKIFTIVLKLKVLSLKATGVAEMDILLNRDMVLDIWNHIPGLNEIDFCKNTFHDIYFDMDLIFADRKI